MSRQVEARFRCLGVEESEHPTYHDTVRFDADLANDDGEWSDFTDITPGGEIAIDIMKGAAALEVFEEGAIYKVTFEKVADA